MGEYQHHGMAPSWTQPAHKGSSHTMSKARPRIKIVHITAPEIIKADVADFRALVQRLTGKPAAGTADVAPPPPPVGEERREEASKKRPAPAAERGGGSMVQQGSNKKIKCEAKEDGGFGGGLDHKELWMDLNPGGFLGFLEEDVFLGMATDFLQHLGSSRMDLVGEMYAS